MSIDTDKIVPEYENQNGNEKLKDEINNGNKSPRELSPEKILNMQIAKNKRYYLVQFVGQSPEKAAWTEEQDLIHHKYLIQEYKEMKRQQKMKFENVIQNSASTQQAKKTGPSVTFQSDNQEHAKVVQPQQDQQRLIKQSIIQKNINEEQLILKAQQTIQQYKSNHMKQLQNSSLEEQSSSLMNVLKKKRGRKPRNYSQLELLRNLDLKNLSKLNDQLDQEQLKAIYTLKKKKCLTNNDNSGNNNITSSNNNKSSQQSELSQPQSQRQQQTKTTVVENQPPVQKPKELPKHGSFEVTDIAKRILRCWQGKDNQIYMDIEWHIRPDGTKPLVTSVPLEQIKLWDKDVLLEFYEQKLKFVKKPMNINETSQSLNQNNQQSNSNNNPIIVKEDRSQENKQQQSSSNNTQGSDSQQASDDQSNLQQQQNEHNNHLNGQNGGINNKDQDSNEIKID